MGTKYDLTFPRAVLGLLAGAVVGPILIALLNTTFAGPRNLLLTFGTGVPFATAFQWILIGSSMVFGIGLVFIGVPLWGLLLVSHRRSALAAATLGFVAPFLTCCIILFGGGITASFLVLWVFELATLTAIGGSAAALVIWRIAYRRVMPALEAKQ